MKKKIASHLNNRGMSSIIIVLILGASLLVLYMSIGNSYSSLNKAIVDLKDYNNEIAAVFDIGQTVVQAYQKASVTSNACIPGDVLKSVSGLGKSLCLPSKISNEGLCSQLYSQYCMAYPPEIVAYHGTDVQYVAVFKKESSGSNSANVWEYLLGNHAQAAPSVWLADIASAPSATISVPTCVGASPSGGLNRDCIVCSGGGKNADCFQMKICTNKSKTCPTSNYIRPVFAIQISY